MQTKSPRVLVVDDDPTARMLCSINLQLEGLHVLRGRRRAARPGTRPAGGTGFLP